LLRFFVLAFGPVDVRNIWAKTNGKYRRPGSATEKPTETEPRTPKNQRQEPQAIKACATNAKQKQGPKGGEDMVAST